MGCFHVKERMDPQMSRIDTDKKTDDEFNQYIAPKFIWGYPKSMWVGESIRSPQIHLGVTKINVGGRIEINT